MALLVTPATYKSFRVLTQMLKPAAERVFATGPKSLCDNPYVKRFYSVGLQADIVDASACPPKGGRYIDQNQVFTQILKPGPLSGVKIPRAERGVQGLLVQRVAAAKMGRVAEMGGAID